MFVGTKYCPLCGAAAAREGDVTGAGKRCPRCRQELQSVAIGESHVLECGRCFGLWLTASVFEKICADREQQAAVLGAASIASGGATTTPTRVTYIPCPECSELMNRANFARCSGVIIDLCKQHGVWFDRDELSQIIQFINDGGLEVSRAKEKAALEEERRRLHEEQSVADLHRSSNLGLSDAEGTRIIGIAATSSLLKFLLD